MLKAFKNHVMKPTAIPKRNKHCQGKPKIYGKGCQHFFSEIFKPHLEVLNGIISIIPIFEGCSKVEILQYMDGLINRIRLSFKVTRGFIFNSINYDELEQRNDHCREKSLLQRKESV